MLTDLYTSALSEGVADANGALCVQSGQYTARHTQAKHIVTDTELPIHYNQYHKPLEESLFLHYWQQSSQCSIKHSSWYQVGNHPQHNIHVRVETEYAWHQLFASHLFLPLSPKTFEQWTLRCCPSLTLSQQHPVMVGISFKHRKVLICGTGYAGEIKKSMFTVLNTLLPSADVLPMHCSAILSPLMETTLLLGLSGTGKTTLSAANNMTIIGDDEHAWCEEGIFNLEGGCYAKTAHLSPSEEPQIFNALHKPAILENVLLNSQKPDFGNLSLTENIRAAYPLTHLDSHYAKIAPSPTNIIFLCCDLFGVIPALSLLSPEQALQHFLVGYTARIGSTEIGDTAITPISSPCFGHPFFPRPLSHYANLFQQKIQQHQPKIWLLNTGWLNGNIHNSARFPIQTTRNIVQAIMHHQVPTQTAQHPLLDLHYVTHIGNASLMLNPNWVSTPDFSKGCQTLQSLFEKSLADLNTAID